VTDADTRATLAGDDPGAAIAGTAAGGGGDGPPSAERGIGRNTAIFSALTGLSRIAGLIREVVASSYFGTSGAFSAFTIAFNFPNLIRSLFADAALSAAFVPVFTELLETKRRKEAFELASTLLLVMLAALGAITAFFIVFAGQVMPLFLAGTFDATLVDLTVGLSRVLFPIVLLLGINGLVVGILNAYGEFSIGAFAPLVWNAIIIACLVVARPLFDGDAEIYAYAVGVLIGTVAQLALALPYLARIDFRFSVRQRMALKDPRVRQVFVLMIPVTIGPGVINFDQYLNSTLGTLVSEQAPRAIDAAFRVYMLPQGMFSVAVATVLFPSLSRPGRPPRLRRPALDDGHRGAPDLPAARPRRGLHRGPGDADHPLVYERGDFDAQSTELVSTALFWFSFSLPFAGANLLLTRTFFSLQRPWTPTRIAGANLAVNLALSLALYKPFGIAGLVASTAVASVGMMLAQAYALRRLLEGGLEELATLSAIARIAAGSALLGGVSYASWRSLDELLGRSLGAQAIAVGAAATLGFAVYAGTVLLLRVAEAQRIERFALSRLRARRAGGGG
jgi:putative peptidoglycan lipid II flippase